MSERFTKIFTGEENLYSESAPVIIRACALLKDTQTGKTIAQLKMQNVSGKSISYVKAAITQLDAVKSPLGQAIEFEYLDLSVADKEEFGTKKPLPLPNSSTRSFLVGITTVAFADGTSWSSEKTDWQSASSDSEIMITVSVEDNYKQALALINGSSKEDVQKAKEMLEGISEIKDVSVEIDLCNKKLDEFDKSVELVKKKSKRNKLIAIICCSFVVLLAIVYLIIGILIPNSYIIKGDQLQQEGRYEEAAQAYNANRNYFAYKIVPDSYWADDSTYFNCVNEAINVYIKNGDIEGLLEYYKNDDVSHVVFWDFALRFYGRENLDSVTQKKIYDGIISFISSNEVTEYRNSLNHEKHLYILLKYVLSVLPEEYEDVDVLEKFLHNSYDPYEASYRDNKGEYVYYNIKDIKNIWKYKLVRDIITEEQDMFDFFLCDEWYTEDKAFCLNFYYRSSGNYTSFYSTLPCPNVRYDSYSISGTTLIYQDSNYRKVCDVFEITIDENNPDKITVYCYTDESTVILYRE